MLLIFEHNPRNPLTRFIVNRCPIDASANLLRASETRVLLAAAGYRDIRERYYLFLPQFAYRVLGWAEPLLSPTRLGGQFCTAGRAPM